MMQKKWRVLAAVLCVGLLAGCSLTLDFGEPPEVGEEPSATPTEATVAIATETATSTPTSTTTATVTPTQTATLTTTPTATRAASSSGSTVRQSTATPPPTATLAPTATSQPPTLTPSPTPCTYEWFTDVPEIACPNEAVTTSFTATQSFENGVMFWFETPGRYVILYESGGTEGFRTIYDPVTIYQDTSGEVSAPAGRYAPVSGFGLVWRGDILEAENGYRDVLGWALEEEYGYTSQYQCRLGPISQWTCYFTGPNGELYGMSGVGTWFVEK